MAEKVTQSVTMIKTTLTLRPTSVAQARQNLEKAFLTFRTLSDTFYETVPLLYYLRLDHIIKGETQMIFGLLWHIMQHVLQVEVQVDPNKDYVPTNTEVQLLRWLQDQVEFSPCWNGPSNITSLSDLMVRSSLKIEKKWLKIEKYLIHRVIAYAS